MSKYTASINALLPAIQGEFVKFMGEQDFVSGDLAPTMAPIRGALPVNLNNIAMTLQNMDTGLAIGSAIRQIPVPKTVNYETVSRKLRVGLPLEYFDELSIVPASDSAGIKSIMGEISANLGEQLAMQANLVRESELVELVTDEKFYDDDNTWTEAKSILTWDAADFDVFSGKLNTMREYLNKASGGNLLKNGLEVDPRYELHMVIPADLFQSFASKYSIMQTFVTVNGLSGVEGGNYKRIELALFSALGRCKVHIGRTYANGKVSDATGEFDPSDITNLWDKDAIYFFTTSANKTLPSFCKEVVFRDFELFSTNILSDQYFESAVRRSVVAVNPYACYKFDLTK